MFTSEMDTVGEIKAFFAYLNEIEKVSFHPDEDFADYIALDTNMPTFSKSIAEHYNSLMSKAFAVCQKENLDIYELAMDCLKSYMSKDSNDTSS